MIRYPVTREKLEQAISKKSKNWLSTAKSRTETLRLKGKYTEDNPIWSAIKPVYMELQGGSKCSYCERKLEAIDHGLTEQDVEHFRPKGNIKEWPVPPALKKKKIPFAPVPTDPTGYYLLPYHIFNYAASCKPCNEALKKDYFPVSRHYDQSVDDPELLKDEKPYLIYPIGAIDEDPETLMHFNGASPTPRTATSDFSLHRALVTIEFFKLGDPVARKNLFRERAQIIITLAMLLDILNNTSATDAKKQRAQKLIAGYTDQNAPHTNCARSFARLYNSNREAAEKIAENAEQYVTGIS